MRIPSYSNKHYLKLQEILLLCYSTPVKFTLTGGTSTFLKPIIYLGPHLTARYDG